MEIVSKAYIYIINKVLLVYGSWYIALVPHQVWEIQITISGMVLIPHTRDDNNGQDTTIRIIYRNGENK